MAMMKAKPIDASAGITPHRAARLFQLLNLLGGRPQSRPGLLKRLRIDLRSFYRDIEYLRSLGIEITANGGCYVLSIELDQALGRLPFPDPCLSVRDVMHLLNGSTAAKRKLRLKVEAVIGPMDRHASY
jgi:predicted DNA-binding transcriptional regulator YafY